MNYLLDTNICIYLIKQKPPEVLARFKSLQASQLFVSSVTVYELQYGVENSQAQQRSQKALQVFLQPLNIIDFTVEDARYAARIRAELRRLGTPIGPYDLQLAGTALANDFVLVSNNTGEFKRVAGLRLENWV